ncbi:MAG: hypothetical protein JNJ85_12640, partial [Candidatus Kapabacteria bacterium]|nr:hypothetical protein [Candidatus Kapabacteria bacterium]
YDKDSRVWRSSPTAATALVTVDDSSSDVVIVNNYYSNHTPVISPWWNTYYGSWGYGYTYHYSPWTYWRAGCGIPVYVSPYNSWFPHYYDNGYCSYGISWYNPWYVHRNPYYTHWNPYGSYNGNRWCSPWYANHYNPTTPEPPHVNTPRNWGTTRVPSSYVNDGQIIKQSPNPTGGRERGNNTPTTTLPNDDTNRNRNTTVSSTSTSPTTADTPKNPVVRPDRPNQDVSNHTTVTPNTNRRDVISIDNNTTSPNPIRTEQVNSPSTINVVPDRRNVQVIRSDAESTPTSTITLPANNSAETYRPTRDRVTYTPQSPVVNTERAYAPPQRNTTPSYQPSPSRSTTPTVQPQPAASSKPAQVPSGNSGTNSGGGRRR